MKVVWFIIITLGLLVSRTEAQVLRGVQNRVSSASSAMSNSGNRDSLIVPKKREPIPITIHYRYLNDVIDRGLDSSINDFTDYLPLPADYIYLGNLGTAARSIVYEPRMYTGFDAGFHALDPYKFHVDSTRYFNTTTPYTRLRYLIGPQKEQLIEVLLTENFKPNLNLTFHFRKINAPGFFQNQNTDDNSINLSGHFNSKSKRYNAYLSFVSNKLHAGENGGLEEISDLKDPQYNNRRTIPVFLGGESPSSIGFFSSPIATQSSFEESSWLIRQQYDWGSGDSIRVNDTTVRYEYYPVFRVAHTFRMSHTTAGFRDTIASAATDYYFAHYGLDSLSIDRVTASHDWKVLSNDLSVIQFPNRKNQAHFLKVGATYKNIQGTFLYNSITFNNLKGHAEYHNLTRNRKWELDARGEFVFAGPDFGDYLAYGSLSRYLNEKLGDIKISFTNINQTPSFVYRFFQSNRFLSVNNDLKKTNITRLRFEADNDHLKYKLQVNYFLLTNYTYFKNFYASGQETSAFNLLQILLHKQFTAGHFNWYLDLALQQATGSNPLGVPLLWTRNRLTYENTLFKNLILCTGLEGRYHTAYHGDNYSPVLQQFVYQDAITTDNPLPTVDAFLHFRIKSFIAYIRAENLNTFLEPNIMEVPRYPYPGFSVRVGIQWAFLK